MPLRRRVHDGTDLSATPQTVFTFGTNLTEGGGILLALTMTNTGISNQTKVTLTLVPFGVTSAQQHTLFDSYILPGDTFVLRGPWFAESGAFISAQHDGASDVMVKVTAIEEYLQ